MGDRQIKDTQVHPVHPLGKKTSDRFDAPGPRTAGSNSHAVKHRARGQFDAWARTYDRSIVQHLLFMPSYRMFLEELYRWRRDIVEPFDHLDIGSGTGTFIALVAGSPLPTGRLVGLDYSREMCAVADGKAKTVHDGAPIFMNGDSEHLPFADRSFDVVTCGNSFHHYPHQAVVVREMHRVLRPGGRLMIVDGFRDNAIGWFVFDILITRGESTPEARVFHPPWSLMRKYFVDAGFHDVRQRKKNLWVPIFLTVGVA